jgi:branched-chain amino acid transport system permease protein
MQPAGAIEPVSGRAGRLLWILPALAGAVCLFVLPPVLPMWQQSLMTRVFIYAVFAISLDLIFGYGGLVSLGHAGFLGIGGYAVGLLMARYGIHSLWLTAPLAVVLAALGAALFGLIALRVSGQSFMLVTFALTQLLCSIALKWDWLTTGGTEGITGIGRPDIGIPGFRWNALLFYYFVLLVFILCYLILRAVTRSPFGYALQGIRENELRMQGLGYNTWLYKYLAFIVAGAIAGLAGALFAYSNGIVVPANMGVAMSANAVFMVILGGTATLYGPVVGAAIIVLLQFFVGEIAPERWPLVMGLVFVLSILYARSGIAVYLVKLWRKVIARYGSTQG